MWTVGRDHTQCHLGRDHGRSQYLCKLANARLSPADDDATAGDNQRPSSPSQEICRSNDQLRCRTGTRNRSIAGRLQVDQFLGELARRREHILRKIEMDRPRPPAQHLAESAVDEIGNSSHIMHHRIPFGQWFENILGIQIHKHPGMRIGRCAMLVRGHQQDGEIVVEGNSGASGEIELARPHLAKCKRHAPCSGISRCRHHRPAASCRVPKSGYVGSDGLRVAVPQVCRRRHHKRS